MNQDRWRLPEGIDELLPDAALALELLRRRVVDLYLGWGYELVAPPFIEYLESLLVGTGHEFDLQTRIRSAIDTRRILRRQLDSRRIGVPVTVTAPNGEKNYNGESKVNGHDIMGDDHVATSIETVGCLFSSAIKSIESILFSPLLSNTVKLHL